MMREKKTIMEMMAELDCDDSNIYSSQTRIAKKQQTANIIEGQLRAEEKKKAKKEAAAAGGEAPKAAPKVEEKKAPAKKGK